ncbi:MAG: hypothetical protein R2882_14380 [Gemmatimonadales bacterium]
MFAPIPKLGFIVVDEEHEGTYKNGEAPRYHARDVAAVRCLPTVPGCSSAAPRRVSRRRRAWPVTWR